MGWGTTFTADIYLSRESIHSKYDLDSQLDEVRDDIQHIREKILMFCAAGPNALPKTDCEGNELDEYITSLHHEMKELFKWYEESVEKQYALGLLADDWDETENKFKTAVVG